MTVTSTTAKVVYSTNGVTTVFSVPFYFLESGHLSVVYRGGDGVAVTQVLNTNYTVSGAGNPAGGSITTTTALATGTLTIGYGIPFTQSVDYVDGGPFPAETHEAALDKLTMIAKQLGEVSGRTVVIPADTTGVSGTLPAPVANQLLGWNGAATGITNIPPNTLGVLTTHSSIIVQTFSGNGVQTTFTLLSDPQTKNNTEVRVSGVYIHKSAYSVTGTSLVFNTAPAAGTNNIEVSWVVPTSVTVGTPTDGTVTPAKLSSGGPSWDASGNLTPGARVAERRATAVASAATVNLSGLLGNSVHITGTTGITAITLNDGQRVTVTFDAALTLTHGASLLLPYGQNISVKAGASGVFLGDASGVTRCVAWVPATALLADSGLSVATARVLGRGTAGSGVIEELTLGSGLSIVAGALTVGSTGGITTIASGSLTGTTVAITNIPQTYSYLVLKMSGASSNTASRKPLVRASTDNGVGYDASAGNYFGYAYNGGTNINAFSDASLVESAVGDIAHVWEITIDLFGYQTGISHARMASMSATANGKFLMNGFYTKAAGAQIDALQMLWNGTGSFDAGTYALYGVA